MFVFRRGLPPSLTLFNDWECLGLQPESPVSVHHSLRPPSHFVYDGVSGDSAESLRQVLFWKEYLNDDVVELFFVNTVDSEFGEVLQSLFILIIYSVANSPVARTTQLF